MLHTLLFRQSNQPIVARIWAASALTAPNETKRFFSIANHHLRNLQHHHQHHHRHHDKMNNNNFNKFNNQLISKFNYRPLSTQPPRRFRPPPSLDPDGNRSLWMTMTAVVVMVLGLSYAAVPLYRLYCQKTRKGGQAILDDDINEKVASMRKVADRRLRIRFEAEKSARLAWDFKPSQTIITCSPGETVLAFYTARNHLDRPVNGIATYTILPYEAGKYFNKIQCFCFEEQQLNANEEVDLPVFFYIDPEYSMDPFLYENDDIVLSYNFFETKEGYKLPKPPAFRAHTPRVPSNSPTSASATVAAAASS